MERHFETDYFVGDTLSAAFSVTFVAVLGARPSRRAAPVNLQALS